MKITALEINQFMRVDGVHMEFDKSGAITIAGDNGSGKTSVETFIELCFSGREKCPQMPVKIGAKKAMGKITLDGDDGRCITIEVEIGQDRNVKAVVRQDGGKPFSSPITMLKALVSRFTFNPFDLMNLRGREQRQVMLDCMGVNFDDLEAEADKIKEERTEVGRDRKGRERQLESLTEHAGVPKEEINMSEVAAELQDALKHNEKCKDFQDAVEEWKDAKEATESNIADIEKRIEALKGELKSARQDLDENIKGLVESQAAASKLIQIDLAPIQKKLDEADEINRKVRANKTRSDLLKQYQADHDRYRELGEQLDEIEKQKQDRLNNAKCPVEGLEFRDDGVWYQGIPLSQDMESDQMIKCVQLASALNPELRAIFIDNGERMLPAKLKELDEWCQKNDYQIIMFRASEETEDCEFYLQDGRIKQ